jgi:hypothetical protein
MTGPAVTAVVAAYRAGDYLRQAIASALAQTLTDLEVLVSDDAGDPEVRRLTESFRDPRIRYRSNPGRLGPARNHWAGFAAARGRYLAVLNHDDLWKPEFLATLTAVLDRDRDTVLAFCDHDVIDPDGRVLVADTERVTRLWGRDRLAPGRHCPFASLVVAQAVPLAMGGVFRREALNPDGLPDVGPAYDLWVAYELCRGGAAAWYVPGRLTAWRVHPAQLTGRGGFDWAAGAVACWQAMDRDRLFRPHRATVRAKLSLSACGAARSLLTRGHRRAARPYARLAIGRRRRNWRAWVLYGLSFLPPGVARRVIGREG